jgi:hypothetical protein
MLMLQGYTKLIDFPTQNAFDNTKSIADAFVTKLNATGNSVLYSTYLGGNSSALDSRMELLWTQLVMLMSRAIPTLPTSR